MRSIDKNDVDINKLFNWSKKVDLKDMVGETIFSIYVRLVGDADLNKARVYALRKSAELRKKLNNPESDEHLAFVPDSSLVDLENLVELVSSYEIKPITADVVRNINMNLPVEPKSTDSLEDMEEYQQKVDEWPKKRQELITEKVTEKLLQEKNRLSALPRNELDRMLDKVVIDSLCENEMYKCFNDMCVFLGSYKDDKFTTRLFSNLDEFLNLPTELKNQIIDTYTSIDINLEDLKK